MTPADLPNALQYGMFGLVAIVLFMLVPFLKQMSDDSRRSREFAERIAIDAIKAMQEIQEKNQDAIRQMTLEMQRSREVMTQHADRSKEDHRTILAEIRRKPNRTPISRES